jgi:hypothetical protein
MQSKAETPELATAILRHGQCLAIGRILPRWFGSPPVGRCRLAVSTTLARPPLSAILTILMQLRPEQTAQIFQSNDCDSFEELTGFGSERSRKIMDAFREIVNPFAVESIAIEDQVGIELNVSSKESLISKTWFRVCPSLTRNPLACAFAHRRVLRLFKMFTCTSNGEEKLNGCDAGPSPI